MSPDAKRAGFRPFSFAQADKSTLRPGAFTATLTTFFLTPTAEPRPFEIPRLLSYYAESFSLSVSGAGAPALAAGGPVLGVLHR